MKFDNIIPTARYVWLTLKHKAFVFQAGRRTGVSLWRLVTHDLSKFGPAEAPHYGRQFFGSKDDPAGFAAAWLHHQNCNDHHWEYWLSRSGRGVDGYAVPLPMPEAACREMIADWMGASRAYSGQWPKDLDSWQWLKDNLDWNIMPKLHPETRSLVRRLLVDIFGVSAWIKEVALFKELPTLILDRNSFGPDGSYTNHGLIYGGNIVFSGGLGTVKIPGDLIASGSITVMADTRVEVAGEGAAGGGLHLLGAGASTGVLIASGSTSANPAQVG